MTDLLQMRETRLILSRFARLDIGLEHHQYSADLSKYLPSAGHTYRWPAGQT